MAGGWGEAGWVEENNKGRRLFWNSSSILVYDLICTFSLMSNCFHGCLKMIGLLRHLPGLCLLHGMGRSSSFSNVTKSTAFPPTLTKTRRSMFAQVLTRNNWTFEFLCRSSKNHSLPLHSPTQPSKTEQGNNKINFPLSSLMITDDTHLISLKIK